MTPSWGVVVAYESLLDLEVELPAFPLTNLFTLGSLLWLVQPFLDDGSGRKPGNLTTWVNVHAQGDVIGSWLRPVFQVDQDFEVPHYCSFSSLAEYAKKKMLERLLHSY